MEKWTVLPDAGISDAGSISSQFRALGILSFQAACAYVHQLPYGYNSDRDDPMILFKESKGTCTTKHAAIAALAAELNLDVTKQVGIYAMTEAIVAHTDDILARFNLPYLPMLHCFLVHANHRVDLTEGNRNGKKCGIKDFLFTAPVAPHISAKDEYLLYRNALKERILNQGALEGKPIKTILQAREAGLALLKANILPHAV